MTWKLLTESVWPLWPCDCNRQASGCGTGICAHFFFFLNGLLTWPPKQIPSLPLNFWVFPSPALLPTQQDVRQVWFGNTDAPPWGWMLCFCYCPCLKNFLEFVGRFLSESQLPHLWQGDCISCPPKPAMRFKIWENVESRALWTAWPCTNTWVCCCVISRKGEGIEWKIKEGKTGLSFSIWQIYWPSAMSQALSPFIHSFLTYLTNIRGLFTML